MMKHPTIAGYIIAFNEEARIGRAVRSLSALCDPVVVVDSDSIDQTAVKAKQAGAILVSNPFVSFSQQRTFATNYLLTHYSPTYILTIDADEWLTSDLVEDVSSRRASGGLTADVYMLHLRIRFDGRYLHWGGFQHTWLPRLFIPQVARYESRSVNEHLSIPRSARVGRLVGHVVNDDVDSWDRHIEKHNRYSTLEAQARVESRNGENRTSWREAVRLRHLRRRWLRQTVWDRLPARPALRFAQIYLFAGGLLDGRAGFRRALFEAWQEMCTDLKVEEIQRTGFGALK